jgi:hypothetical protein
LEIIKIVKGYDTIKENKKGILKRDPNQARREV